MAASNSDPVAHTWGFVLTYMSSPVNWKLDKGDEDCPHGYNETISGYLAHSSHSLFVAALIARNPIVSSTLPAAMYTPRTQRTAAAERTAVAQQRTSVADRRPTAPLVARPWLFDEAPAMLVEEGFSRGMNLDGVNAPVSPGGPATRAHKKFQSPTGEYVDNEMYRVFGCYHGFRTKDKYNFGLYEDQTNNQRVNGVTTTLIEVHASVDDHFNSDDATVGVYLSADRAVFDNTRPGSFVPEHFRGLPYVSYTIKDRPGYSQVFHGKIRNGILTTSPADLRIENAFYGPVPEQDYYLRGARLTFDLKVDQPTGMIAGYFDVDHAYHMFNAAGTLGASHGFSAPAMFAALRAYADGYPDKTSGQFTAISSAFDIELTTAYVIHPKPRTSAQTAANNR